MGGPLAGLVALVTGSGGGLGRAHALALTQAGARVVVNDVGVNLDGSGGSRGPADAVVHEIRDAGGEAVASYDSVADFAAAGRIVHTALDSFGRLDVVVNNASVFHGALFSELTEAQWDAQVAVHLKGAFNICKHALPVMVEQQYGRVINTTSRAWYSGAGLAAYAAVKGALVSLTYDLAAEYLRHGITINALAPDAATPHRLEQGAAWIRSMAEAGLRTGPSDRTAGPPPPEFVPPIAVYLASPDAGHITGRVFFASGGTVGMYAHPALLRTVSKDEHDGHWTQDELRARLPALLASDDPAHTPSG